MQEGPEPRAGFAEVCDVPLPLRTAQAARRRIERHRQTFADVIWEDFKSYCTNMGDSKIIARHIELPLEHHVHSASTMNGDISGIGTTAGQLLGSRPLAELAQYRIPGSNRSISSVRSCIRAAPSLSAAAPRR